MKKRHGQMYHNYHLDLIVMDIHMPVIDGLTAAREIREDNPDLQIIALSSFTDNSDKQKAFEAGYNGFLTKPITSDQLKKIVGMYP